MGYKESYEKWLNSSAVDEKTKAELRAVTDEKEIEDRFVRCSVSERRGCAAFSARDLTE